MKKPELATKAAFLEKLGHLLDGGVPLFGALEMLEVEAKDPRTKQAAARIISAIDEQGEAFSLADSLDPNYFTDTERTMLLSAAKAGRLDRGCLLVVKWLDRELSAPEAE